MKIIFLIFLISFNFKIFSQDLFSINLRNNEKRICGNYTSYDLKFICNNYLPKNFTIFLRFSHAYYNTHPQCMLYHIKNKDIPGFVYSNSKNIAISIFRSNHFFSHPTIKITLKKEFFKSEIFNIIIGKKNKNNPGIKVQYYSEKKAKILCIYKKNKKLVLNSICPEFEVIPNITKKFHINIKPFGNINSLITPKLYFSDMFNNLTFPNYKIKKILLIDLNNNKVIKKFLSLNNIKISSIGNYIIKIFININNINLNASSNAFIIKNDNNKNLYFGDFHGHSSYSDGIGDPIEYLKNAQNNFLDFTALTEHDKMITKKEAGIIENALKTFNKPTKFICFAGWEYDILCGDRNFYYFNNFKIPTFNYDGMETWKYEYSNIVSPPPVIDYKYFRFSPLSIYNNLNKNDLSLVIQHTPASATMGNGLDFFDANIEKVIEIYSSHGNSLYKNCINEIPDSIESGFVVNALNRGYKLGFVACGDSHAGKPGKTIFGQFPGGLTALYSKKITRKNVYNALKSRYCYATTGNRPIIEFNINNKPMGSQIHSDKLDFNIKNTSYNKLKKIKIFCNGNIFKIFNCNTNVFSKSFSIYSPPNNSYYFAEFSYENNYYAWNSPIFITPNSKSVILNFSSKPYLNNSFKISFNIKKGTDHNKFKLYRRLGNNGNNNINKYDLLDNITSNNENFEYIDKNISDHISYYYLLKEEMNDSSISLSGPVSCCLPPLIPTPLNKFNIKEQKINFFVNSKGKVIINFYYLSSEKIITSIILNNISKGLHTFNAYNILKDKKIEPVFVAGFNKEYFVASYRIISNNISSSKKTLCWNIK